MAASLMIWMNEVQKYLCLKIAVIQSTSEIYGPFLKNDFEGWIFGKAAVPRRWGWLVTKGTARFDSMAVSIFADILTGHCCLDYPYPNFKAANCDNRENTLRI